MNNVDKLLIGYTKLIELNSQINNIKRASQTHSYIPISNEEYTNFLDLFNNTDVKYTLDEGIKLDSFIIKNLNENIDLELKILKKSLEKNEKGPELKFRP